MTNSNTNEQLLEQVLPKENITFSQVQQKWDNLISFSQQNQGDWVGAWGQAFKTNPFVQNTRLKQIKTVANRYTREELEEMLRNPSNNEQGLRSASHYFHNTISPIMKMNHMYADMLTYRTYINTNKVNDQKNLIKEYETLSKWKKSLDPKTTFREITLQSMIEGKKFYYYREDKENNVFTLQEFPSDYVKIVHRTDIGWKYSFNMMYFLKVGVSPDWFAEEFKDYINEFFNYYDKDTKKMTNIDSLPDNVTAYYENRNWYFWKELDIGKAWCFGVDSSAPEVTPPLASMFLDANELNSYKLLEQELMSIPLKQIMTAEVPFSKESKNGNFANDTSISPDLIQLYQNIIQSILPNSVDFIAAPFTGFNIHTFDSVASKTSIVGDAVQNFYSQGGVSALVTTTSKPNISMVKTAQIMEAAWINKIYNNYRVFLNNCVKNMGFKNEFEIQIEGDVFGDKDLLASIEKALTTGNMNIYPQYLSFFDQDLCIALGNMTIVNTFGIYELMKPLVSSFQQSEDSKNGRPSLNPDDITSEGSASSAESGSNTSEGRIYSFLEKLTDEKREELIEVMKEYGYEIDGE